jgi:quinol monooxygenase YgiN
MTVTTVVAFHVRPGKEGQLLEAIKTVKKIVERAGGTMKVSRQVFGPQPGDVVAVAEYADWSPLAKLRSDPELQQFLERMRNNPEAPAELVVAAAFEEVAL